MSNFAAIAPYLNLVIPDPNARFYFDMFAGALVWSDELRSEQDFDLIWPHIGRIRAIWNYRTSLILGEPNEKHKAAWDEAQQLCPHWPVFRAERRDPKLAAMTFAMRDAAYKKWDEDNERIDQLLDERKQKATV